MIKIDTELCKGCHYCADACPLKLIKIGLKTNKRGYRFPEVDNDKCTSCGMCYRVCPDCCIEVWK